MKKLTKEEILLCMSHDIVIKAEDCITLADTDTI